MPWSCECGSERGLLGCSNPNCDKEEAVTLIEFIAKDHRCIQNTGKPCKKCLDFYNRILDRIRVKRRPRIDCDKGKVLKGKTTEVIDCPVCSGRGSVVR